VALEQPHATVVLQRLDLVTYGGRRHGQFLGRRTEAPQARDRFEGPQHGQRRQPAHGFKMNSAQLDVNISGLMR
jgi:hypothetical protein